MKVDLRLFFLTQAHGHVCSPLSIPLQPVLVQGVSLLIF